MNSLNNSNKMHIYLIIITLASLLLRVGYVLKIGNDVKWPDEQEYHGIAINLIEGRGYSYFRDYGSSTLGPTAYRSPAIPAMLAVLYLIFGTNLIVARLFQAFLGALIVLLAYYISIELGYSRRASILAAIGSAFYPYYIFSVGAIYPITITTFLVCICALFLLKGRKRHDIWMEAASGFILGASILAFGHIALALPLIVLWIRFNKTADIRKRWIAGTAMAAACAIIVVPWIIRNKIMLGYPTLSTAMAYNLAMGNHPDAKWDSGSRVAELESKELKKKLATMREGEAARYFMKIAIQEIKEEPGRFIILSLGRALNFWRFYPKPATRNVSLPEKLIGTITYGSALIISFIWFIKDKTRIKLHLLFFIFLIAAMCVTAATVSTDRYRLPFDIFLIIMASGGIASIFENNKKLPST